MGVWVWQQGWKLEWSGVLKMMQAESRQDYIGHMQRQLLHYICWRGEGKKKQKLVVSAEESLSFSFLLFILNIPPICSFFILQYFQKILKLIDRNVFPQNRMLHPKCVLIQPGLGPGPACGFPCLNTLLIDATKLNYLGSHALCRLILKLQSNQGLALLSS